MPILEVLLLGDPLLREKSEPVTEFNDELEMIITDLKDTLQALQRKHGIGRALAAPQLGYFKQVIYFKLENRGFAMINPEITWKSDEKTKDWDTCYSFKTAFFVKIPRHKMIEVTYFTPEGLSMKEEAEGPYAALIQHEEDHLHGVLAVDLLEDSDDIIIREEWEKIK